ncbi:MAG: glycosyltransferase [Promethearchaeota archaeon]
MFIDQKFDPKSTGGAFKSNFLIIKKLLEDSNIKIEVLARDIHYYKHKNLKIKKIRPIFKSPIKKINKLLDFLRINQYLSFFQIISQIKKFKPNLIIVQRDLTIPALLAAFFKKIPIINIIRDGMSFCPKYIDVIECYKNCLDPISKKKCWDCIDRWQMLRIILKDNINGAKKPLINSFYSIYYKINYFIIKFYLKLLKRASINIVASPLMKTLIINKIGKINNILIKKITPIEIIDKNIEDKIEKEIPDKIKKIKNEKIILYIIPRNEGGSKGYPFVYDLIKKLKEDYYFIVVGVKIKELEEFNNVVNLEKIPTNILYYLYQIASVTIVPSIYTEAFGRVIIESIINQTPVICSPQCGANFLFKNKEYVKVIPLNLNLWIKEIKQIITQKVRIPEKDIIMLKSNFSPDTCQKDLLNIIKKLVKKRKE